MCASILNTVGLICDIVGAILLWVYVAEISFADKDAFLKGIGRAVIPNVTPEMISEFRFKIRMSRLGIGLLVFGFLFQLAGNWVE